VFVLKVSVSSVCLVLLCVSHFLSFLTSIGRDRGSLVRCRGIWVDSSSVIGHISDIASIAVSLVGNMLGTAIRKSNGVRSLSVSGTITSLSSVEVGVGVVISNSVGVSVGGWLIRVSRGMVSGGSMDYRGMVSRGSMDNWGSVDNRGMISRGSVDNWGSMVDRSSVDNRGSMVSRSMSKDSLGSMKTVRRVSDSGNSSSESL